MHAAIWLTSLALLVGGIRFARAASVTLVSDGKAASTIVLAPQPTPAARLAALEIQYHVEQITGVRLSICHPGDAISGVPILVGESDATVQRGLNAADFPPQEYLVQIGHDAIVLFGRDWEDTDANRKEVGSDIVMSLANWRSRINYDQAVGRKDATTGDIELPGPFDDQGTCYAVYDFLERFCDVRWYGPSLLNLVVPSQKTLAVPCADIRRSPSLLHRNGYAGGIWPILLRQWDKPSEVNQRLFYRRMRFGGERWAANHSFSGFRARFLVQDPRHPEHWERSRPDFFAVGWENEGDWRQLCLTNPDLVRQVAQDARDFFDGKPAKPGQLASGDYFAVVPQDSDHWCKCERCQAILAQGKGHQKSGQFESGTASDYVFGFVNAAAKELQKTHPTKYISTLAYHVYSYPPTFPLEPNVAVAPCLQTCYLYSRSSLANTEAFYGQWAAQNGRRLHVWNYFHHPMERAIMQGFKCFPVFMPDVISTWVKRYERDGVRGFYLCGVGEQLDYYLYMQTAFNTATDGPQLIDEFFTRYFGAAGVPLKQFYYRISEINREERVLGTTPEISWDRLGTEPRMKELGALMNRAVELAATDLEKQRVETWRRGIWDYMNEGREDYLKQKRARAKKDVPISIFSTGVDDRNTLLPDRAVDPHWRLTRSPDSRWPGPNTYACESDTPPTPAGATRSTASKWITPHADLLGMPNGTYLYEQTFILSGVDPKTASIVGRMSADDLVERIELNGVNVGQAGASFAAWRELVIADHFIAGTNILRIVVKNNGPGLNPHGLRMELSASADRTSRVAGDPIDRLALVRRHNPIIRKPDPLEPLSIGNGAFAFSLDVTGLQTFTDFHAEGIPLCTESYWGWHTSPNPENYSLERAMVEFETYGRKVKYPTNLKAPGSEWLRSNPHRLGLAQVGLALLKADKSPAGLNDLVNIEQTLDLWTGLVTSRFSLSGSQVEVRTSCHPDLDAIAVSIKSPLLAARRLGIRIRFPYGSNRFGKDPADWDHPDLHQTAMTCGPGGRVDFRRTLDADRYYATLISPGGATPDQTGSHQYTLLPTDGGSTFECVVAFSPTPLPAGLPTARQCEAAAAEHWRNFWNGGAAVDFSGSTDPRARELERRVVLSQYLLAIQSAGPMPPPETGLTCNSWYGKPHLECHWLQGVQFALWGRLELLERTLPWYQSIMPAARRTAELQGYAGIRWPKMVGPDGREGPSAIAPLLIWQQPHPIYYGELCYRADPSRATLEKYKDIVFQTAEFMVSYPVLDKQENRYVLGPPVMPAQENYDARVTRNPTFELAYWRWGLETAQKWRERLNLSRDPKWDRVLQNLSPLPMKDGLYLAAESVPDTWSNPKVWRDHPSMLAACGMLPGAGIDREVMRRTLHTVIEKWNWGTCWGWDFPLVAMTAARVDEPGLAVDALMMKTPRNHYLQNGHNFLHNGLPVYLTGNGSLLAAVAMMAGGWDGAPERNAPGFPQNAGWVVRSEGFKPMP